MKSPNAAWILIAIFILAVFSCKKDKEKIISVDSIEIILPPGSDTVLTEGEIMTVTVNVSPADATNKKVTLVSDNPAIISIAEAATGWTIKAEGVGRTSINAASINGKTATILVTVVPANSIKDDGRGNKIEIPYGALSCATKLISFTPGNPWTSDSLDMDPDEILGLPDRGTANNGKAITLGAGGIIIVEMGVHFTNGEGMDIYVFEVGPSVEATKVEISDDLKNWFFVGNAEGSLSGVDISGKVPEGSLYKYIRLTDLRTNPGLPYPGADIDAVSVLHPVLK